MAQWEFIDGKLRKVRPDRGLQKEPVNRFSAALLEEHHAENDAARAIMLGLRSLGKHAGHLPDKWFQIKNFCITCAGSGRDCSVCKGTGRLPEPPKTGESEKARVIPFVSEDRRAVMVESAWPIGELYERIMLAKEDSAIRESVRSSVRKLTRINGENETEVLIQAQVRDQAMAFLGIYSDLNFWLATQERIETVVRLFRKLLPFGLTVRIETAPKAIREKKELTPEQLTKRSERAAIKGTFDSINTILGK